jgi:hypothetical protein
MQKSDWKYLDNFWSYSKKSDFDSPSWIDPQLFAVLTKYEFGSCCWSKYKLIAKYWMQNVAKSHNYVPWFSAAILDIRRHPESDKKPHFYKICLNWSPKQKTERKNFQNSSCYGQKPIVSHFEIHRHFVNLRKGLPNILKNSKFFHLHHND